MPTAQPAIRRAGYFHFGRRAEAKPVEHLRKALKRESREDLAESLLVLPEGFNMVGEYDRASPVSEQVRQDVIGLSEEFGLAMVAGWIRDDSCRLNLAELIDGTALQYCISGKYTLDTAVDYDPVQRFRPRVHRGVGIAALICLDSSPTSDASGHGNAPAYCKWMRDAGHKSLLCIPACLGAVESKKVMSWWKRQFDAVVLSNCTDAEPSMASARQAAGFDEAAVSRRKENSIGWVSLGE